MKPNRDNKTEPKSKSTQNILQVSFKADNEHSLSKE